MTATNVSPGGIQMHKFVSKDSILLLILAIAFFLRVYQALSTTYIWDEERDWIPIAESISFQPQSLHLPIRADFHGALPAYFIELGGLLLGKDMPGFRFPSILAGMLTIYLAYRLSLEWFGLMAARWTAALFTFNEFHISISILAIQQSFYLLFVMSSLYAFSRFLKTQRVKYLYLATGLIGLAFLCYEISVLFLAVFVLALLAVPDCRVWLRQKELYLAGLLFVIVISPDLVSNFLMPATTRATYDDQLSKIGGIGFTPHYLNFFLRDGVLVVYKLIGRTMWDKAAGYPTMNIVFGVMLLGGVFIETLRWRQLYSIQKLLLLAFWTVLGFFVLIRPGAPTNHLDPILWLWVDATLLPACVLLGRLLADLSGKWRMAVWPGTGIAVLVSLVAVGIRHLGMPFMEVGFSPDFLLPPDGRNVLVKSDFNFCRLCDRESKVDILKIELEQEWNLDETPRDLGRPECAKQVGDVCSFVVPATLDPGIQVGDYNISFLVTDRAGHATPYLGRLPVISDISRFPFRPVFWTLK